MEIQTITTTLANKYRTLNDDPQYFGGYLNMARLNVFNISNHIAKEFGLSLLEEEGHIKNSFLCNKSNKKVNWNRVHSRARRFLSILKVFDAESLPKEEQKILNWEGKDFALMSDTLKIVFGELQEFRNDYSHYYSTEKGTSRKIKVSDQLAAFLETNFKRAIEYTKDRFRGGLNEDDFALVGSKKVVREDLSITTEGLVFLASMFLEREYAFQFIGKITGLKGTQNNSFIATREVLMAYCLKLPHDRFQSDNTRQAFSLDLINELNRCPKELYNVITEEEKQQFRPKLEELEIKNLLDNSTNSIEDIDVEAYDEYIEALTKRIRHTNRFSDFALKFIDETDVFKKLRFQIDLGKLLVDEYDKPFNGEAVERKIIVNAKAFGKLNSFDAEDKTLGMIENGQGSKKFEQFSPHYNTANNKIGISSKEHIAKLLPNSKGEAGKKLHQPLPEAFLSLKELPKIILLDYLQKGEAEKLINDFILVNNSKLMNMPFIEEVKRQLPKDWNEFKRRVDTKKQPAYTENALNYLLQRKQILNEVLAAYQLNDKQIPGRILDYWLNIEDVEEDRSVSDRIKSMKRDCMSRLKALAKFKEDRNRNKIPKIGEMATFLAKDIVDMVVSEEKKQKITSFYYDKMQECLALFADPERKQLFIHTVTNELNLNEAGGHPFLHKLNLQQIKYTSGFYEIYLQEKGHKMVQEKNFRTGKMVEVDKSWMMLTFYKKEWNEKIGKQLTVVKLPENKSNVPFSLRLLEEKTNYTLEQWLHNLTYGKTRNDTNQPVNLPTNLFDEKLAGLLQLELDEKQISYPPNAYYNELFKIWWKSRNDGTQSFYKAEREYVIFDETISFLPDSKAKFADYYQHALTATFQKKRKERIQKQKQDRRLPDIQFAQVEKTFKQTIAETEKEIRMVQEEDRTMLLMLENLMENGKDLKLKLTEVDTLLNDATDIKQLVTGKLSFNDLGGIISDKTNPEISRTITVARKRKDYSMLRKFVFDRRLPELFEYFAESAIPIEVLKEELDAYNKAKQEIFDSVFELEQKIIAIDAGGIHQLFVDKAGLPATGNIQHKPYLIWLQNKGLIDSSTFTFLNMVRNCFSHNQYPQKKTMELLIDSWEPNRFALTIAETYNQKIASIMRHL